MATARTAASLGLEQLAQADGALRARGYQRHDPLGELRKGLRDRQQVLSLEVPVGEKLEHPLCHRNLRKLTVRSGPAGTSATTFSASSAKGFETACRSSRSRCP